MSNTKDLDKDIRDLFRENSDLPDAQITALGQGKPRKFPWIQVRFNELLDREQETMGQFKNTYEFIISIINRGTERDAYEGVMDELDAIIEYTDGNDGSEPEFTINSTFHNSNITQVQFEDFAIGQNENQKTPFMAIFITMEATRYEKA